MSVVLVTGCSSGFGLVIAARLAAAGHTVFATMRNLAKRGDLEAELARRGAEAVILPLDVASDASVEGAIAEVKSRAGRLDVLVNNAGMAMAGFFEDLSLKNHYDQMEANFFGAVRVTRAALPLMRRTARESPAATGSKAINISSVAALAPLPGLSVYSASKSALEGLSESLSLELKPFGIAVVLLEPGSYRTKIFTDNAREGDDARNPESPYRSYSEKFRGQVSRLLKSSRGMGNPEDVAALVERIVLDPAPKIRHIVAPRGGTLVIWLRRLLPFRAYAALIRRGMFGELS